MALLFIEGLIYFYSFYVKKKVVLVRREKLRAVKR